MAFFFDFFSKLLVASFEKSTAKTSKPKLDIDCELIDGDIDNINAIENTITGTSAIIYNIGIIREFPSQNITYEKLHFESVKRCIDIAQKVGVKRFILMSANGVKKDGTRYQTSKWKADEELKRSELEWTIFRPSLIFGNPNGKERTEFCTQLRNDMLNLPFPAPLFFTGFLGFLGSCCRFCASLAPARRDRTDRLLGIVRLNHLFHAR